MTSHPIKWEIESLDSLINRGVIKLNRGNIISKHDIAAHPGEYPIYSSAKENNGMFGRYGKYMFDEEVITWSIDGGGRLFYREKQKFSVTNVGGILRIIDKNVFDYKFLFYVLTNLHSQVIFDWSRKAHPSVIRMVYDKIPIPPLAEQQNIVELLEDHLQRLDAALADVKHAKLMAVQLRRSLLKAAFTGNLGAHGTGLMTQMPNGWRLLTLGEIANWTSGGTPSSKNSDFYDGDIPWVCIGDLNEGSVLKTAKKITKVGLDSSSAKIMPKGTVMLAMYATSIGDTGIMETYMATNQAIACGVPNPEMIDGKYLLYYLQSQKDKFFAAGRGGAQPNINQGIVKGWPIPVPSVVEQRKIVELLENHLSRLEFSVSLADAIEKQSTGLRRSLLQAAFTGQLTKEVVSV